MREVRQQSAQRMHDKRQQCQFGLLPAALIVQMPTQRFKLRDIHFFDIGIMRNLLRRLLNFASDYPAQALNINAATAVAFTIV